MSELVNRIPSSGHKKQVEGQHVDDNVVISDDVVPQPRQISGGKPKLLSMGLRLAYNELTNLDGFHEAVDAVMENPVENLSWLDLSHNKLVTIDGKILHRYTKLAVVYLHGNNIKRLADVVSLAPLMNLQKITLHGNEHIMPAAENDAILQTKKVVTLEENRFYRLAIIYYLRNTLLKTIDFVGVTPADRKAALIWAKNHRKKRKVKPVDDGLEPLDNKKKP